MAKYLFRMDDICPTMDVEKFQAFEKIFKKYDIQPLMGIIPENKDPSLMINDAMKDFWDQMRGLVHQCGWEVSQHGYQHIYHTKDGGILNLNKNSETSGQPYQEQFDALQKGKNILHSEGLESEVYMAPSHSYDLNTLKALKALDFKFVTDGYSFYPYTHHGLTFVPCQMAIPRTLPFGIVTFCIHSNMTSRELLNKFESFIQNNIDNIVKFSTATTWVGNFSLQSTLEKTILASRKVLKAINL